MADALYGVGLPTPNEGSREMEEIEQPSVEDLGLSSEQMKNSSEELVDFLRAIWAFAPRN